jgi:hypothetical protein
VRLRGRSYLSAPGGAETRPRASLGGLGRVWLDGNGVGGSGANRAPAIADGGESIFAEGGG